MSESANSPDKVDKQNEVKVFRELKIKDGCLAFFGILEQQCQMLRQKQHSFSKEGWEKLIVAYESDIQKGMDALRQNLAIPGLSHPDLILTNINDLRSRIGLKPLEKPPELIGYEIQ